MYRAGISGVRIPYSSLNKSNMNTELKEILEAAEPVKERKIDFARYSAAANKTVEALISRVNLLLEVAKSQQEEIKQLKEGRDE